MNILTAPIAAKVAVAVLAGAIALGGAVAASAAANEALFGDIETTEPTPTVEDDGTEPVDDDAESGDDTKVAGPDATGSAAWGLCNARAHGGLPAHSTAGAALDAAAEGDVEAYCATVSKNGSEDEAEDETDEGDETADTEDAEQTHGNSGNGHGNSDNGHGNSGNGNGNGN